MTTSDDLYEKLPKEFKSIFGDRTPPKNEQKEQSEKTPFEILQETLKKIKEINKR